MGVHFRQEFVEVGFRKKSLLSVVTLQCILEGYIVVSFVKRVTTLRVFVILFNLCEAHRARVKLARAHFAPKIVGSPMTLLFSE